MPTYRVMDSDGIIVDTKHEPSDVSIEEVITWYKNMLTGRSSVSQLVEIGTLIGSSQYHGCHHVRGAETRSSELLHGMVGPHVSALSTVLTDSKGLGGRRRYCSRICICAKRS